MTRTRLAGLLLLLCVAAAGWHLIRQPPPATTAAPFSSSTRPTAARATAPPPGETPAQPATSTPATSTPATTATPLAVTPRPTTTPVRGDVPQDRVADPDLTPGPDQRHVEAEEPSVDQLTDAQLQTALERQTAGQGRLQPVLERAAAEAAWKQVHPTLTAARTWSHIRRRAAVALTLGQDSDPAQPIPVNVITTWTGADPDGLTGVHRAETKLLHTNGTWQPVN